jgi:hypothetical protein
MIFWLKKLEISSRVLIFCILKDFGFFKGIFIIFIFIFIL